MVTHYPALYVFSDKGTHMAGHILWLMGLNQVSLLNLALRNFY